MRIFFIGTVQFSKKALKKLIEINADIVGVATKSESKFNTDYADLTDLCAENNIPFKYIDNINSDVCVQWIKSLRTDVIFCFGWSNLLKKQILELTPMGVIGFHPTLLPKNRGRHPLIWALINGLSKTGTTFFFMDEGADTGDILSQKEMEILHTDYALDVYKKMISNALTQIEEFVPRLENGNYQRIPQEKTSNYWRKRSVKDGRIDFRMGNTAIYNLVRGLSKPYVGAHIDYRGKEVKVWKTKEIEYNDRNIEAGKVLKVEQNTITVKCGEGAIDIIDHEFDELPGANEYL